MPSACSAMAMAVKGPSSQPLAHHAALRASCSHSGPAFSLMAPSICFWSG